MNLIRFFQKYPMDQRIGYFNDDECSLIYQHFPSKAADFLMMCGRTTFLQGFLRTLSPGDVDFLDLQLHWGLKGVRRFPFLCTAFGTIIFYMQGVGFQYINPIRGEIVYMGYNLSRVLNDYLASPELIDHEFFAGTYFASQGDALRLQGLNVLGLPANYDPALCITRGVAPVYDIRALHQEMGDVHSHKLKVGMHSFSANCRHRGDPTT